MKANPRVWNTVLMLGLFLSIFLAGCRNTDPNRQGRSEIDATTEQSTTLEVHLDLVGKRYGQGWAEIYLDGDLIGDVRNDDDSEFLISAGKHTLRVEADGFEPEEVEFRGLPGNRQKIQFSLHK